MKTSKMNAHQVPRLRLLAASIAISAPLAWADAGLVDLGSPELMAPPLPPTAHDIAIPEAAGVPIQLRQASNMNAVMSRTEADQLQLKREALIKYLYESENLEDLRELIHASERTRAYRSAKSEEFPLTPAEIRALRLMRRDVSRAENAPLATNVDSRIRTVRVDIESPKPISLDVTRGFASSIVFYDESGQPWPLASPVIGDIGSFKSQIVGEQKHIAVFEILRDFAESNALINLEGLPVPLVVRLRGSESVVDSRLSLRIPRLGPNAAEGPITMTPGVENASSEMMEMLNGGALTSGRPFQLVGVTGSVFHKGDALYIRTKGRLVAPPINPPLSAEMTSPTGFNVYRIPPVTQLLFSVNGELVPAQVEPMPQVAPQRAPSIFSSDHAAY